MRRSRVEKVKAEMNRLSNAILELDQETIDPRMNEYLWAPKQTGAVRRASMDLTRALADLRKP